MLQVKHRWKPFQEHFPETILESINHKPTHFPE